MNKIGILVLNHNGRNWLPTVYDSIFAQGFSRASVYLIDNDSKDDSVGLTREKYPQVTIIRMSQNLGYCMAYNIAMPYAFADGCDWVVWANNDIKLESGCLEQLVLAAQSDPRIGVVGPSFLEWDGEGPNDYMIENHPTLCSAMKSNSTEPMDVEWVEGSFLMVSQECVKAVGPLDPYLFLYWEETDFCRRARHQKWRVALAPGAIARHYAGGWSGSDQQNRRAANRLQSRNFYIYNLADPFGGFTKNSLNAVHLFLTYIKQYLIKKPSLAFFHLHIFAAILANFPTFYRKWTRDRLGERPPVLQDGVLSVEPEIIRGKSANHSPCEI